MGRLWAGFAPADRCVASMLVMTAAAPLVAVILFAGALVQRVSDL
ncbi:MAG: hypothetical protein QF921_04940 [Pseudomonadales bacterium]|jgi:hypothetical protein|nr:hypothetical protein [Pseudomonadales bacterium]MDP6471856.1 hypothetical protein [Pseudomonadales bacterium]MDP6826874.1 hypothetical protein [Pseudomonadales bacterium]MDP6970848.1 hypothetical protein [Pseudomonadales bacterium]|tara:strand:+ start:1025 stop:1159 length:135 start_codon:yes stop_codon:yes gene_type:complete